LQDPHASAGDITLPDIPLHRESSAKQWQKKARSDFFPLSKMMHASFRCGRSRTQACVEKLARDERAAMAWSAFSFDGN